MIYKDIKTPSTRHDRVVHVYRNKCVLNARASCLFYNPTNPRVGFRTISVDLAGEESVKTLVFIGAENEGGYHVSTRKGRNEAYICSVDLCDILRDTLDGYGAYRISEHPNQFPDGKLYYQILPDKLLR